MSDEAPNSAEWVVETKPVVSTVVPTPEAIARQGRSRWAPTREQATDLSIFRRFSPRRSHWPEVAAYDKRAAELQQRAAALNDEISRREEALRAASLADREALAQWQLTDGKRRRPAPTAPTIKQEIETKKADRDAALAACERVYEDKAQFVEKNRKRLVREADRATRDAQARYAEAIEAAEQARGELVDCRAAALWAALFPGELANQVPDVGAVAANLRKPVEDALQLKTRLPAVGVFRVLRSDVDILGRVQTREQALALGAADPQQDAATWAGTPEHEAQAQKERQEALERYKAMWGHYPT